MFVVSLEKENCRDHAKHIHLRAGSHYPIFR